MKALTPKEYFAMRQLIPALKRMKKPFEIAIANGLMDAGTLPELHQFMGEVDSLENLCREFEATDRVVLGELTDQGSIKFTAVTPNEHAKDDIEYDDIYLCKPWLRYFNIDRRADHPRLYRITITPIEDPTEEEPTEAAPTEAPPPTEERYLS